ncbi:hypothetical protein, partial [Holdemania sp. 1001095H_141210_F2]|uniref:hypothetical protein n=1 Tax=Holdemania sp. 1001095H_141210_F2 TaxID=2787149 RepID=UPI00189F6E19
FFMLKKKRRWFPPTPKFIEPKKFRLKNQTTKVSDGERAAQSAFSFGKSDAQRKRFALCASVFINGVSGKNHSE